MFYYIVNFKSDQFSIFNRPIIPEITPGWAWSGEGLPEKIGGRIQFVDCRCETVSLHVTTVNSVQALSGWDWECVCVKSREELCRAYLQFVAVHWSVRMTSTDGGHDVHDIERRVPRGLCQPCRHIAGEQRVT